MGALGATLSFRFRAGRNISILTWDGDREMDCNRAAEIYMTKKRQTKPACHGIYLHSTSLVQ